MGCTTCGLGVPQAPGLSGGPPMTKAALRDYWLSMPGVGNTGGVRLSNPGRGDDKYAPDGADEFERERIATLSAVEPVIEQYERNPRSWLLPPSPDLAVVGLGWNASNLAAVAPFPMARTGYVQNPRRARNSAPPLPPGAGFVAVPVEPPGWSGLGQGCWQDDDCRRDEYCHAGRCVTSPWTGRGAGTQVEVTNNPQANVGPLSIALQATGQIPPVPWGSRVSQADVAPGRRRLQNPGGGAYQEFVHPL